MATLVEFLLGSYDLKGGRVGGDVEDKTIKRIASRTKLSLFMQIDRNKLSKLEREQACEISKIGKETKECDAITDLKTTLLASIKLDTKSKNV